MADLSSSGLAFFILVIIFTVVCGIFVVLRFVAARISRRRLYLDDGLIVFAYVNMVALGGGGLWAGVNGIGKSVATITEGEIVVNAKLIMISNVCWLLASVFVKLSILWLYQRLFTTPVFRRWAWGMMAIVAMYGVAFLAVFLTNCRPIDHLWNPQPGGYCRDMQYSDYATIAINLFFDIAILILPMPSLWSLQMARRKKTTITILFSLGFATIAVMLYRIVLTIQVRGDPDFVKHLALIGIMCGLEVWFGIIIACVPTLAPLARPALTRLKSTFGNSGHSAGASAGLVKRGMHPQIGGNTPTPQTYRNASEGSWVRLNELGSSR